MSEVATLAGIFFYPIKSCAGTRVDSWSADSLGLRHDRRFMLTDSRGVFLSQRELPRMSLISPRLEGDADGDALRVSAPEMETLNIPLEDPGPAVRASVWGDVVQVERVSGAADRWFSRFLGVECRLVRQPEGSLRRVDPDFANPEDVVSLADGFPFLMVSESSLEDLNSRLEEPLPMDRFRPNLTVSGCGPFAEDDWKTVRIGEVVFRVAKPCARCAITTVDQRTAGRSKEPLRTLATFRNSPTGVLFGQNLIHETPGVLRAGDPVHVLD